MILHFFFFFFFLSFFLKIQQDERNVCFAILCVIFLSMILFVFSESEISFKRRHLCSVLPLYDRVCVCLYVYVCANQIYFHHFNMWIRTSHSKLSTKNDREAVRVRSWTGKGERGREIRTHTHPTKSSVYTDSGGYIFIFIVFFIHAVR